MQAAIKTQANCHLPFANCLLNFLMPCVLAATLAELLELKPTRSRFLVLGGRVVSLFAIAALLCNYFSHKLAFSS
jgi:uncharacterized membrane protein